MGFELGKLSANGKVTLPDDGELRRRIALLLGNQAARYRRLWAYYRNPITVFPQTQDDSGSERPYRQAQEWGLPPRITGVRSGFEVGEGRRASSIGRKEVVIENDIGWRIETQVDYLFGKPVLINSSAADPQRREIIGRLLRAILAHNGGLIFLQQLALISAVYGFVDVLVKLDPQDDGGEPLAEFGEAPGGEKAIAGVQQLGQKPAGCGNGGADDEGEARGGVAKRGHGAARGDGEARAGANRVEKRAGERDGAECADGVRDGTRDDGTHNEETREGRTNAGDENHDHEFKKQNEENEENEGITSTAGDAPDALKDSPRSAWTDFSPPSLDGSTDPGATITSLDALLRIARRVRLEIVEPARALPLLSPLDYRVVDAYAQCYAVARPQRSSGRAAHQGGRAALGRLIKGNWLERLKQSAAQWLAPGRDREMSGGRDSMLVVDVITAQRWQRYEDERLVAEGENALGQIPLVHIQNTAVPFEYAGDSDVEQLIPLQDELNTRLSDRANRIALQSFKMYLGKGIENFTDLPVSPGQMWMSDNDKADVVEFGGDANAPSELAHIQDLREAMDKLSAVTPIAAGAIKNRIGRLTSAAALRITMLALLSKTEKRRTSHGMGIQQMLALALAWLDKAGLFATSPQERGVELNWPSPLPANELEKLQEAEIKSRLGVPREVVLRELGY